MTRSQKRGLRALAALVTVLACGDAGPGADASAAAPASAASSSTAGPGTNGGAPESAAMMQSSAVGPEHAEGLRLYHDQFCGTCHTFAAAGTGGVFGPAHDSMAAVADHRIRDPDYHGSATTADAYVRESLTDPGAYYVPGYRGTRYLMPPYRNLSDAQLDALVRLLLHGTTNDGG